MTVPSAAEIMRRTADYVATHAITYDALAGGPLGEALTRAELEHLADNEEAVAQLVTYLREAAKVGDAP